MYSDIFGFLGGGFVGIMMVLLIAAAPVGVKKSDAVNAL
jgi:hypothetical protein